MHEWTNASEQPSLSKAETGVKCHGRKWWKIDACQKLTRPCVATPSVNAWLTRGWRVVDARQLLTRCSVWPPLECVLWLCPQKILAPNLHLWRLLPRPTTNICSCFQWFVSGQKLREQGSRHNHRQNWLKKNQFRSPTKHFLALQIKTPPPHPKWGHKSTNHKLFSSLFHLGCGLVWYVDWNIDCVDLPTEKKKKQSSWTSLQNLPYGLVSSHDSCWTHTNTKFYQKREVLPLLSLLSGVMCNRTHISERRRIREIRHLVLHVALRTRQKVARQRSNVMLRKKETRDAHH